jgi:RNA polymerase sigma-70 factor, ECF subfamily
LYYWNIVKLNQAARAEQPLPEEGQLVLQAKAGDSDAFAQLYDGYVERIYRYIYFRVSDDETAEDLTSQVFLKAWEHLDRYQSGESPFLAWIYRIARNQVIDHYRTHKEFVSLEEIAALASNDQSVVEEVQNLFDMKAVRDAMRYLTKDQQDVVVLKFIAGLSTEDIANMMKKREGAIRALQMRALQTLAKYLKEEDML